MPDSIKLYFDYKSPFAFLAMQPAFDLPQRFDVEVRWIPYLLRIKGKGERSVYSDWKARYSYMDARRWANRRGGFPIKGPQKVYDSTASLIGGLYGLCIGKVFFGESMFSGKPNTSKMAMLGLTNHMQSTDLELIDCQVVSQHLVTMGAGVIPRSEFTQILENACCPPTRHECWPQHPIPIAELLRN